MFSLIEINEIENAEQDQTARLCKVILPYIPCRIDPLVVDGRNKDQRFFKVNWIRLFIVRRLQKNKVQICPLNLFKFQFLLQIKKKK